MSARAFREARDLLLKHRTDYAAACAQFRWPLLERFNWAITRSIFAFIRERVAPYKRIRRIEFGDLPKTISGKILRVQLRAGEQDPSRIPAPNEFREEET